MIICLFWSCSKKEFDQGIQDSNLNYSSGLVSNTLNGMTVLGEEIPNPYTVDNMDNAYASLKSKDPSIPDYKAKTTHLYIRFLPNDFSELDIMKKDSTLIFFDVPLHYKIKKQGRYYHDPSLSANQITWQYSVIEVEKKIPDIHHEILAEVCIPDSDKSTMKSAISSLNFFDLLEIEARSLIGMPAQLKSTLGSSWTPAGTIKCVNGFPIEYIEVKARNGLKIRSGWTDEDGIFTIDGSFISDVKYSIDWERYNFSIREGFINQASYSASEQTLEEWKPLIGENSDEEESEYHALIYRAAYHYYYKDIHSLKRPPLNGFFQPQMKIDANFEFNVSNGNHASWRRVLGIRDWINIYNPQHSDKDIYGTVIHELAHASHWDIDAYDFNSTEPIVKESWACGVEIELTIMVYSNYWRNYGRLNYTGIVEDLIDGIGSKYTIYWFDYINDTWGSSYIYKSYSDQVSGYTIKQIEDALIGQENWNDWRDNIKNKYNNGTENKLDAAFAFWNTK